MKEGIKLYTRAHTYDSMHVVNNIGEDLGSNSDKKITRTMRFVDYFAYWIETYKKQAVRQVTYEKYLLTLKQVKKLWPKIRLMDLNYTAYQKLLNKFGKTHELATLRGFHQSIKASLIDAIDADLVDRRMLRHIVLHAKPKSREHLKYLNLLDLKRLLHTLQLKNPWSLDWIFYLVSKTGLRISEALGITEADFDFRNQTLHIWRTWNYKKGGGFDLTKNASSRRTIDLDPLTCEDIQTMLYARKKSRYWNPKLPIFVQFENPLKHRVYLSTINYRLKRRCQQAKVPVISIHGLRHTHASLLIYDGVSLGSVAKRLGHANTLTTQKIYVHVVKEMVDRDRMKIVQDMIQLS